MKQYPILKNSSLKISFTIVTTSKNFNKNKSNKLYSFTLEGGNKKLTKY